MTKCVTAIDLSSCLEVGVTTVQHWTKKARATGCSFLCRNDVELCLHSWRPHTRTHRTLYCRFCWGTCFDKKCFKKKKTLLQSLIFQIHFQFHRKGLSSTCRSPWWSFLSVYIQILLEKLLVFAIAICFHCLVQCPFYFYSCVYVAEVHLKGFAPIQVYPFCTEIEQSHRETPTFKRSRNIEGKSSGKGWHSRLLVSQQPSFPKIVFMTSPSQFLYLKINQ